MFLGVAAPGIWPARWRPEEATAQLTVPSMSAAAPGEMTYAEYAQMLAGHLCAEDVTLPT